MSYSEPLLKCYVTFEWPTAVASAIITQGVTWSWNYWGRDAHERSAWTFTSPVGEPFGISFASTEEKEATFCTRVAHVNCTFA